MRQLIQVIACAAVSLLTVALAMAFLFLFLEQISPSELFTSSAAFRVGFQATLMFGVLPAILFGAPAYWWIWRQGQARWLTILPLGAVLGLLVFLLDSALIGWGVGCGALVAGLTHILARRWLGAKPSGC